MLKERKPLPHQKSQAKVIWYSNLDFCINPDPDPEVCRIAPKTLWIIFSASVISTSIIKNWAVTV